MIPPRATKCLVTLPTALQYHSEKESALTTGDMFRANIQVISVLHRYPELSGAQGCLIPPKTCSLTEFRPKLQYCPILSDTYIELFAQCSSLLQDCLP